MRRHVENVKDGLGIIGLSLLWLVALMALSVAANGLQKPATETLAADLTPAAKIQGSTAAVPSPSSAGPSEQTSASEQKSSNSDHEVTLTRFILISIPDRQLAFIDNGQVVKIYPIAVGAKGTPSPEGDFTIISRVSNPTWNYKGQTVAPGKNNPVGSRWMGLSLKGYGIHGTNAPRSIGKAASHGCFRMGKKDIEDLFKLARVGDTVAVRAQRDDLVAQVFGNDSNAEVQVASSAATANDAGQN